MISKNNEILAITQNQYEQSVAAYAMAARSDLTLSDFITPRQKMTVNDGVARIHISGALTDQAPPIHEVAGGTDYRSLRSEIAEAKSQGVDSFV
jgi:ClpP class serine protease